MLISSVVSLNTNINNYNSTIISINIFGQLTISTNFQNHYNYYLTERNKCIFFFFYYSIINYILYLIVYSNKLSLNMN